MERLQKVLARAGIASRRGSEELIQAGKVRVNGHVVTQLGTRVDPTKDQIEVEGRPLKLQKVRTFLFYKPKRVITSLEDPQSRKVVTDYVRHIEERLYPVGRLDYDTEGLLLLTNDGDLAYRLTHPKYEVKKVYQVTVKGIPNSRTLRKLAQGVQLEDGLTAPAEVRLLDTKRGQARLELTIHEGRNRQVRRMCEAVGHPVLHLIRTRISFLTLKGLQVGQVRELSQSEISRLRREVGLNS